MNILPPNLESHRYDTYGVVSPKSTHTRPGKCEEVTTSCMALIAPDTFCNELHCGPHVHGWQTLIDVSTELGQKQARYIVDHSGRHWKAEQKSTKVTFTFPAGQQCFTDHRLPVDRPPLFTLKKGHIISPGRVQVIDGNEWLERFGENQINLKQQIERG